MQELDQAMKKGNGCDPPSLKRFSFIDDRLQFTCQVVSKGWEVFPTEGNEVRSGSVSLCIFHLV